MTADSPVSTTAKLCIFARAFHSVKCMQPLFDDYLAFPFMGYEMYEEMGQLVAHDFDPKAFNPLEMFKSEQARAGIVRYVMPIIIGRIGFAEEALARFAQEHPGTQYVVCGAGLDTYLWRNDDSSIRVFEVDHPATQKFKRDRLAQLQWAVPPNARLVEVDFTRDDMTQRLVAAGFDPMRPAFYSILGVSYYLTPEELENTIAKAAASTRGTVSVVLDFPDETTFNRPKHDRVTRLLEITANFGEPMKGGFSTQTVREIFARHGFHVTVYEAPNDIEWRCFAADSEDLHAFENVHHMIAERPAL